MKRLLIIGCGDVARRALPALTARYRVSALVRDKRKAAELSLRGVHAVVGDLDEVQSLDSLWADENHVPDLVLHSAPPGESADVDQRTRHLVSAFTERGMVPQRLVYISTSGVYGDCGGALVDESRPVNPQTPRARRRVDAEAVLSDWGRRHGVTISVLRAPGIYAGDRLPRERIRRGMPALHDAQDVHTNHIHADDLADIAAVALEHPHAAGVFNASDDSEMKMGEYLDLVAKRQGLPRPARISRNEAESRLPEALLSFWRESRRLDNRKLKRELGVSLRFPTVLEGVPFLESTALESTALESTALDSTALDSTALDSTALDSTALDSTALNPAVLNPIADGAVTGASRTAAQTQ